MTFRSRSIVLLQAIFLIGLSATTGFAQDGDPFEPASPTPANAGPFKRAISPADDDRDPFGGNSPPSRNTDQARAVPPSARTPDLTREYRIKVTDRQGDPIPNAVVYLHAVNRSVRDKDLSKRAYTWRDGVVTLHVELEAEAFSSIYAKVQKSGFQTHHAFLEKQDREGSGPVVVHVELLPADAVLRATILGTDGKPANNVCLTDWWIFEGIAESLGTTIAEWDIPSTVQEEKTATTDANGGVTILADKTYWRLERDGTRRLHQCKNDWLASSPIGAAVVSSSDEHQTIRLQPWVSLRGRVRIPKHIERKEERGDDSHWEARLTASYVFPNSEGRSAKLRRVSYQSKIDEEGRYEFPQVVPGYVTLSLKKPNDNYLKQTNGRGITQSLLLDRDRSFNWDLSEIAWTKDPWDRYRERAAAFDSLRVNDATVRVLGPRGNPLSGVTVHCILPLEPGQIHNMHPACLDAPPFPLSRYPTTKTDEQGEARFRFKGTALAVWIVSARDVQYRPGRWLTAHDVTKLDGPITVAMSRNTTIGGTVVDSQGRPVPKTRLKLHISMPGRGSPDYAMTDDDGRWSYGYVPEGATVRWIDFDNRKHEHVAPTTEISPSDEQLQAGTLCTVMPSPATLVLKDAYPKRPSNRTNHCLTIFAGSGDHAEQRTSYARTGTVSDERITIDDNGNCTIKQLPPGPADLFVRLQDCGVYYRRLTLESGINTLEDDFGPPSVFGIVRIVDAETLEPVEEAEVTPAKRLPVIIEPERHDWLVHWVHYAWRHKSAADGTVQVSSPDGHQVRYRATHPDYEPLEFDYVRENAGQLIRLKRKQEVEGDLAR